MSDWMFRWFLMGKSYEEIAAASSDANLTAEKVRKSIESERASFEERCLRQLVLRAKKGDATAIDWLAKRGLFKGIRFEE